MLWGRESRQCCFFYSGIDASWGLIVCMYVILVSIYSIKKIFYGRFMKYMEDDDSGTIFGDLRRIGVLTNDIFFHIYNDSIHNLKNHEPTYADCSSSIMDYSRATENTSRSKLQITPVEIFSYQNGKVFSININIKKC